MQDSGCAPLAGHQGRYRVVPTSSARLDQGAAPSSHAQAERALQLLWRERQPRRAATAALRGHPCMAEVAEPKKSASANELEAVSRATQGAPAPSAHDQSADLGQTVRRPSRRAGWCKSPRPDLARAPVGDGRGYSTYGVSVVGALLGPIVWRRSVGIANELRTPANQGYIAGAAFTSAMLRSTTPRTARDPGVLLRHRGPDGRHRAALPRFRRRCRTPTGGGR